MASGDDGGGVDDFLERPLDTIGNWSGGGNVADTVNRATRRAYLIAEKAATREALADGTIDDFTKAEISEGRFVTGSAQGDLAAARKGEGVFGDRQRGWQTARLTKDRPGVLQTMLTAGQQNFGDMSATGMPSLVTGGVDPVGVANLVRDSQKVVK